MDVFGVFDKYLTIFGCVCKYLNVSDIFPNIWKVVDLHKSGNNEICRQRLTFTYVWELNVSVSL